MSSFKLRFLCHIVCHVSNKVKQLKPHRVDVLGEINSHTQKKLINLELIMHKDSIHLLSNMFCQNITADLFTLA